MSARSCVVCRAPANKWCSTCKSASYCSEEHQKEDWQSHRDYCRKVKKAGANTFDAILFPVNESKPRIVKVPYELIKGIEEYELDYHKPDLSFWFNHKNTATKPQYFNHSDGTRVLCFFFDDNFGMNRLPLNQCIVDVTDGKAGHGWCGNAVGFRIRNSRDLDFLADANMEEDLEEFVRYFKEYGAE